MLFYEHTIFCKHQHPRFYVTEKKKKLNPQKKKKTLNFFVAILNSLE